MSKSVGKVMLSLLVVMAAGLGLWGCGPGSGTNGGGDGTTAAGRDITAPLGLGLEDVSPAGMESVFSEGMDAAPAGPVENGAAPAGPEEVAAPAAAADFVPPPPPPAPPWWPLLHPLRARARDEAREVIEAPAHLFFYIMTHRAQMPACIAISEIGGCPLDRSDPAGACSTRITFTAPCQLVFTGNGQPIALGLSGALALEAAVVAPGSAPGAPDGKWNEDLTAESFVVSDPVSLRSMTYDGTVSRSSDGTGAAAPYTFRHVWSSDAANDPMTLVDGRGDQLIAAGVRDIRVIPGDSVEEFVDAYPTLVPALVPALVPGLDPRPRHFHRNVHRAWVREGDTVAMAVDAVTVNLDLDRTWTHSGDYTVHREAPTTVTVSGRGAMTFPDGRGVTTELIDVTRDLTREVPISGTAITTYDDGLIYTVTFSGACLVQWENNRGGAGQVDLCRRSPFDE